MRLVCCHRMPCLAYLKADGSHVFLPHRQVFPVYRQISLTQTELCRTVYLVGQTCVEIRLHLGSESRSSHLVSVHIDTQPGSKGEKTERIAAVQILRSVFVHLHILGYMIEEVSRTGYAFSGIESEIVPDETVELEMVLQSARLSSGTGVLPFVSGCLHHRRRNRSQEKQYCN